jgi:hypothetical protein
MEERERARNANRIYLCTIHRKLAEQLERLADECQARADEYDALVERASKAIRQRER